MASVTRPTQAIPASAIRPARSRPAGSCPIGAQTAASEPEAAEGVRHVRHPARHHDEVGRESLFAGNRERGEPAEDQVEERVADADDVDLHPSAPTRPGLGRT